MYYNKFLRIWVLDLVDYFLISAFIGSLVASNLKRYFSEKAAMERLKKSIINKSGLVVSKTPILESKKSKTKRIYKFALGSRGGQLEEFQNAHEFPDKLMKMAQQIQQMVERLAAFLKQRELKGLLKIFFCNGKLILKLILSKCNINLTYEVLTEGLTPQVIVITSTVGGAAGFTLSWFAAGAILITPSLFLSILGLRSFAQQILTHIEFSKLKDLFQQRFEEDEIKETLQVIIGEESECPVISFGRIKMGPSDLDQNPILKHHFSKKSSGELDEFVKERLKEELGLVENPTETQIEKIIQNKVPRKPKGKTVFFRDFIKEISDSESDLDIIDAEIIEESIRVRPKNEL